MVNEGRRIPTSAVVLKGVVEHGGSRRQGGSCLGRVLLVKSFRQSPFFSLSSFVHELFGELIGFFAPWLI